LPNASSRVSSKLWSTVSAEEEEEEGGCAPVAGCVEEEAGGVAVVIQADGKHPDPSRMIVSTTRCFRVVSETNCGGRTGGPSGNSTSSISSLGLRNPGLFALRRE
jgi:hypothetical protein